MTTQVTLNIPASDAMSAALANCGCSQCGVTSPCCPDPIPGTLILSVAAPQFPESPGVGACVTGKMVTLTYDSMSQSWKGTGNLGACFNGGNDIPFELLCDPASMNSGCFKFKLIMTLACVGLTIGISTDDCNCSPFQLEFDYPSPPSCTTSPSGNFGLRMFVTM